MENNTELNLANLRRTYALQELLEQDAHPSPYAQFEQWFHEAEESLQSEANAMIIATALPDGTPSLRTVLLKGFSDQGLLFFTNYNSKKGKELAANPKCSILFFWHELERQIRIEGIAHKVERALSEEYFSKRPRGSQLGAAASHQSEPVPNKEFLNIKYNELEKQYHGVDIPTPEEWGGYRIMPSEFEFWQGRPNRLHDRLQYTLVNGAWRITRLSP